LEQPAVISSPSEDHLPRVVIAGQTLEPQPERALLWVERETLLVADLHIGKAATFRDHAIPIPTGTTVDDLQRLSTSLVRTKAGRLIVLGDLFHSVSAQDERFLHLLRSWRERHSEVELAVVPGNHDQHAGSPAPGLGWRELEEGHRDGPFSFRHFPEESDGAYVFAGHIHPLARVRDGRESVLLPCFHFSHRICTLPAFSTFTGGSRIRPRGDDIVFVAADDAVIRIR
jgi:DNA ligase-associated metallophosphoesterase